MKVSCVGWWRGSKQVMGWVWRHIHDAWRLMAAPRPHRSYHNVARRFFAEKGFKHVVLMSADGALEAAPAMGSADMILDLVGGVWRDWAEGEEGGE